MVCLKILTSCSYVSDFKVGLDTVNFAIHCGISKNIEQYLINLRLDLENVSNVMFSYKYYYKSSSRSLKHWRGQKENKKITENERKIAESREQIIEKVLPTGALLFYLTTKVP